MSKQIRVVGAVISRDGQILCAQRGPGGALPGLWEFPGGKIEPNEEPHVALAREIDEELGCEILVGAEVTTTSHQYDFGVVELTTFYCVLAEGEPQKTEHAELKWVDPTDLEQLDWAPADMPAVSLVRQKLSADVS